MIENGSSNPNFFLRMDANGKLIEFKNGQLNFDLLAEPRPNIKSSSIIEGSDGNIYEILEIEHPAGSGATVLYIANALVSRFRSTFGLSLVDAKYIVSNIANCGKLLETNMAAKINALAAKKTDFFNDLKSFDGTLKDHVGEFTVGHVEAWEVLGSNSVLRKNIDNINSIKNYLSINPDEINALKSNLRALIPERQQAFVNGIRNAAKGTLDIPNARRGNLVEISSAVNRIADHRGTSLGGNFGYLEGQVSPIGNVNNQIWRSGAANPLTEPQIFTAIAVEGTSGASWLRNTDSEYKMLNRLAFDLGATPGNTYLNVNGSLTIVSEFTYCASCQGIIQQFNTMFPNINLTLIDGVR